MKKLLKSFLKSFLEKDSLSQRALLLFLGFFMTYYVGNWMAMSFQNRMWENQHKITLQESETQAASKVFEEVSGLVDKRIYRMTKLNWQLEDNKDEGKVNEQMDKYRDVLYEWNDSFNKNRALIARYFGTDVGEYYSNDIHSAIKDTGKLLENYYYTPARERKYDAGVEIDGRIWDLEGKAYEINIRMLELIQKQEVGVFNPDVSKN